MAGTVPVSRGVAFEFRRTARRGPAALRPVIPVELRFDQGSWARHSMLVDSGGDRTVLNLDCALHLGMRPWQMRSGVSSGVGGTIAPVAHGAWTLEAEIGSLPIQRLPFSVYEQRGHFRKRYDVLGREALFGPLTIVFEERSMWPRVVFHPPGSEPFSAAWEASRAEERRSHPSSPSDLEEPSLGEGWASFPYWRRAPNERPKPIVPVRLWRKKGRSIEVPMLVDTGTTETAIAPAVARDLELPLWRMPTKVRVASGGSPVNVAYGLGVTLHAQIGGLPPVSLPFTVMEVGEGLGPGGLLGLPGLLDAYRLIFHRLEGTDRVTFLDAERFPPS